MSGEGACLPANGTPAPVVDMLDHTVSRAGQAARECAYEMARVLERYRSRFGGDDVAAVISAEAVALLAADAALTAGRARGRKTGSVTMALCRLNETLALTGDAMAAHKLPIARRLQQHFREGDL